MNILTSKGFRSFEGILDQGISTSLFLIKFESGNFIKATGDHRFLMEDGELLEAELIIKGDVLSLGEVVESIEEIEPQQVYDIYEVEETHDYYSNGVISHNCNLLYIDEASIIPNNIADAFFTAVYPVISAGQTTKILITSTPLGYNHFWKFWNDAQNKRNDFVPLFIPYWKIPGRDEKWAEEQKRQLGELKYNQEILCLWGKSKLKVRDKYTGEVTELSMEELYEILESRKDLYV